jgi:hypothetical protein
MRTLQQLAQEAIDIQNACNPLGLTKGFARATQEVCDARRFNGESADTDQMGRDPIVRLWASKLHDLTGMGSSDTDVFREAYENCLSIAKGV